MDVKLLKNNFSKNILCRIYQYIILIGEINCMICKKLINKEDFCVKSRNIIKCLDCFNKKNHSILFKK